MALSREMCVVCRHVNAVGFHVPNDMWKLVIPPDLVCRVVCLSCFTRMADEKLIQWDREIELYPVSLATHLDFKEPIGPTTREAELVKRVAELLEELAKKKSG